MEFINNDWFIVSSGFAPLYSRPSFNSNCLTEMAYGDSCKIFKIVRQLVICQIK